MITEDSQSSRSTDSDLAFDIAMGMSKTGVTVKDRRRVEALRGIAGRIVEHLALCGWRWHRRNPERLPAGEVNRNDP